MSCCDIRPQCIPPIRGGIYPFFAYSAFTPVIPKLYWNVKSQEQRMLALCDLVDKIICYEDYLSTELGITKEDIDELKAEFEAFKEHGFDEYYEQQVIAWINEHMEAIISASIHMTFFGLTDDGYFCTYIPESWHEIVFDTVADYSSDNYGCLVLKY